jgi:chemotaxis protein CheD
MKELDGLERVIVYPGQQEVARGAPVVLGTLLGSCVAVCLYDPVAGIAGMNHFMLANRRYARGLPINITEAGRYGVYAMELLINAMMAAGADRKRLEAKAFGGGAMLRGLGQDNFECVGEINVRFVLEFLKTEGIALTASDLGGDRGRVIRFRTDNFKVYRRFIIEQAAARIERREHGFWERAIAEHDRQQADEQVILFR